MVMQEVDDQLTIIKKHSSSLEICQRHLTKNILNTRQKVWVAIHHNLKYAACGLIISSCTKSNSQLVPMDHIHAVI